MKNSDIRLELGDGNEIIRVFIGNTIQVITFDELKKIWKDLDDVEPHEAGIVIEYINAAGYDDKVVCCAYVSEGQGGIVFVWDTSLKQIIHYTNGCFAIKATIHNDMVYVLRLVSYWGVKAHLEFDFCKLGTKSCEVESTNIPLPEEIASNISDDFDDYEISFDNHDQPEIIIKKE